MGREASYDISQKQEGTVIKFDKNHNLQSVLQLKQLGEGGWEGNSRERFVANQLSFANSSRLSVYIWRFCISVGVGEARLAVLLHV
jgi:hypothetical protein